MRVDCAPLLYGRTFKVDFQSRLLAQPVDFSLSDAADALEIIRCSMDHSDFVERREVIFTIRKKFVVSGVVTKFDRIFQDCGRTPLYTVLDGEGGRPAHGFIGVVIRIQSGVSPFDVPTSELVDMYCDMIKPIWNRSVDDNIVKTQWRSIDVPDQSLVVDDNIYKAINAGLSKVGVAYIKSQDWDVSDVRRCAMALAIRGSRNIAFCTNIDDIRNKGRFNIATCRNPQKCLSALSNSAENQSVADTRSMLDHSHSGTHGQPQGYDAVLYGEGESSVKKISPFDLKRSKTGDTPQKKQFIPPERRVQSYDDVLCSEPHVDEDGKKRDYQANLSFSLDSEINRLNNSTKKNNFSPLDGILTLGTIGGITYLVVGIINAYNPIVLALVGGISIVIVGYEAKKIINMFM